MAPRILALNLRQPLRPLYLSGMKTLFGANGLKWACRERQKRHLSTWPATAHWDHGKKSPKRLNKPLLDPAGVAVKAGLQVANGAANPPAAAPGNFLR